MFVPYCFKIGRECPFEIEGEDDFAFVLMPFAPEFDEIYRQGIKEVWNELGFRCLRSDEDIHTHDIMCHAICQNIQRAHFIVADMTGRNPNVFYELGLAHAFGKPVILITQRAEDVPFDLKAILYIDYGGDIKKLNQKLTEMAEGLLATEVTLSPPRGIPEETPLEAKPEGLQPAVPEKQPLSVKQELVAGDIWRYTKLFHDRMEYGYYDEARAVVKEAAEVILSKDTSEQSILSVTELFRRLLDNRMEGSYNEAKTVATEAAEVILSKDTSEQSISSVNELFQELFDKRMECGDYGEAKAVAREAAKVIGKYVKEIPSFPSIL